MATHSRILAWKISWTEESGGLWFMGSQESDTTVHTDTHSFRKTHFNVGSSAGAFLEG